MELSKAKEMAVILAFKIRVSEMMMSYTEMRNEMDCIIRKADLNEVQVLVRVKLRLGGCLVTKKDAIQMLEDFAESEV